MEDAIVRSFIGLEKMKSYSFEVKSTELLPAWTLYAVA